MRRFRAMLLSGAMGLGVALVWVGPLAASSRPPQQDEAGNLVEQALQSEIDGTDAQRRELLESVLEDEPDHAAARWHTGHVKVHGEWVRVEDVAERLAEDQRIAEYRQVRGNYEDTVEGQLALAQWCLKRRLQQQARAHLTRVLELNPDHPVARRMLGYRRVGDQWVTEAEIREQEGEAKRAAAALSAWRPRLEKIAEGLEHRLPRQRDVAARRLAEIDDPQAVQGLLLIVAGRNEEAGLLVIETLARMDAPEATIGLAQQAVFSRWPSVRQAAAEELKSRDTAIYVPVLLGAMSSEIESQVAVVQGPGNQIMYRHLFFREGQEQQQMAVLDRNYQSVGSATPFLDHRDMVRDAVGRAQSAERMKAQNNAAIRQLNERIVGVINTATGERLPVSARDCWQWWNDVNGVFDPGRKRLVAVARRDSIVIASDAPDANALMGQARRQALTGRENQPTQTALKGSPDPKGKIQPWQRRPTDLQGGKGGSKEVEAWQKRPTDVQPWQVIDRGISPWQIMDRDRIRPWQVFEWQNVARWQARGQPIQPWQSPGGKRRPTKEEPAEPETTDAQLPESPGENTELVQSPADRSQLVASPGEPAPLVTTPGQRVELTASGSWTEGGSAPGAGPQGLSCLARGTTVWTDAGPVPIEQVRVGDLVLSQDVETGEVTFKPVLRTVARPAGTLMAIGLAEESVRTSAGQLFWVSGQGWVKARELEPGARLHTVTGTAEVVSLGNADSQESCHLVVADFHTFFVGSAKTLTHDNTIREPTRTLVPGLVPDQAEK